ncbi:flagellar biosynthesis anti-sigma factor FlgM [Sphingopyxis sp.]|uniref:flagellar biosynthesis anti-sigma factor FlgM n=1 Tax=Sphingopyxis sp. TaxID=1908224 RepID=UPI003D12FB0C
MSGDSKIGPVGGVIRTTPVRKIAGSADTANAAASRTATSDTVPGARLIRLASDLAAQAPPVDTARVAALRTAIAEGTYTADAKNIALAMLRFAQGRTA